MSASDLILKPRISEKTYGLSKLHNTYVFDVPKSATKLTVADAVKAQFNVTVLSVNVMVAKGKPKRTIRRGRAIAGRRSDVKRAYVLLKDGDHIPVFASLEDEAGQAGTDDKTKKETK